jgi:hypothetical protein
MAIKTGHKVSTYFHEKTAFNLNKSHSQKIDPKIEKK